ncbi:unnamed protein product [Parajaminaea phylloscopi]
MSLSEKLSKLTSNEKYKRVETGLWRALDPVGKGMNKIAGRLGAESFWPTELAEGEIEKAARILRTFTLEGAVAEDSEHTDGAGGAPAHHDPHASRKTQKVVRKIPQKALRGACGLAIFTCFRTGLGWSGASGSGLVVARLPDGSWSPPSGILIHTLAWGFLIGVDVYDVVLVIRKPETLKAFTRPKVSIGAEFSVAAGPVGNGAVLDAGLDAKPVWAYSKSKGAYVGVQLDGTVILNRDDANGRFFGRPGPVTAAEIFSGALPHPPATRPLLQTLYAGEGNPQILGTDAIPSGQAPGDRPLSQEEVQALASQTDGGSGPSAKDPPSGALSGGQASSTPLPQPTSTGPVLGQQAEAQPPAYSDLATDPFASPPASQGLGWRAPDAAAEKEALRRQYAAQDAAQGEPAASSAGGVPGRVRAEYDFKGTEADDLSFTEGEIIDVIGREGDQWYRGSIGSRTGIFPCNYVSHV